VPRGDGTGPMGLGPVGMRRFCCHTGSYANGRGSREYYGYGFGNAGCFLRDQDFNEKELLERQVEFFENHLKLLKNRISSLKNAE